MMQRKVFGADIWRVKGRLKTLNTCFWNVGREIADIRLRIEGAFMLFEGDADLLHALGVKNNEKAVPLLLRIPGIKMNCMICWGEWKNKPLHFIRRNSVEK